MFAEVYESLDEHPRPGELVGFLILVFLFLH
jgi:hypothetical protein